jgi:outer membrane protein TolC
MGTDWDVDGGEGISDPDGWSISAIATWNFWEWGRTKYGVKEKLSRLSQARHDKEELYDIIRLEVKRSYLKARESEINITTVEKAIEQAKENLRISEEQYKHQVATSTDVLDAQTLLSETMTNYYNALYDFKIAKASLRRVVSLEVIE